MNERKRLLIIGVGVLISVFIILLISSWISGRNTADEPKEAERGGPVTVLITNTDKLNAVMPPPQFFATKDAIAAYLKKTDPAVDSAAIESTELNPNGSVTLRVRPDIGKTFLATAYQNQGGPFVFQVPAANYTATISNADVRAQYGSGE